MSKITHPLADQIVAISTCNVGVGPGGSTHMLARVAIVDYRGQKIYETFVAPSPRTPVADYRTAQTGIEQNDLQHAPQFSQVQQDVAQIIRDRVLVGHSLWLDLSVLGIPHPAVDTRDVALYQPFRNALRVQGIIGLKTLVWHFMRRRCGEEYISPIENARAVIDLYRSSAGEWENAIAEGHWPCR